MKILKLARTGDDEDDCTTSAGFMEKIISIERRSKSLPKGSAAREQAVQNVVEVMLRGLKEFGENWASQWIKPVSYNEALNSSFAGRGCFVWKDIDQIVKVANQLHEYRKVLPVLFGSGAWNGDGSASKGNRSSGAEKQGAQPTPLALLAISVTLGSPGCLKYPFECPARGLASP